MHRLLAPVASGLLALALIVPSTAALAVEPEPVEPSTGSSLPEAPADDEVDPGEVDPGEVDPGDEEPLELASSIPVIIGSPVFGQPLGVDVGSWTEGAEVRVQWQLAGVDVPGATAPTWVPPIDAIGKRVTVAATGELDGYLPKTEVSAESDAVAAARIEGAPTPKITGNAVVDQRLTAVAGSWPSGVGLAYQWQANGAAIAGATASAYTVTAAVAGKQLTVVVTGTKPGYERVVLTSAPTKAVALATLVSAVPTVSGTAKVDQKLTAKPGTWSSGTKLSYQWFASGKAISGATASSYTVGAGTVGKTITVRVTGTKAGYTTVVKTSKATGAVVKATLVSKVPTVSGTAKVGQKLTAKAGTWSSGTKLSYQWFASGKAISGATASSYTVGAGAVGKTVTVRVTGTKAGYTTVAKTSKATKAVVKGTLQASTPTVGGKAALGSTLTAKAGTWTAGTKLAYQWKADGTAIAGATKASFRPNSAALKGKALTVTVTGTKGGYTTASRTSKATAKVSVPGRTGPASLTSCPSWAPIKGNADSGIYHLPHQRFYKVTHPEDCFSTEAAAVKAGYRKAKV